MKYRAVLFDFDGTLTPSLPLWVKAFRLALAEFGHEFADDELIQRFFYRDWTLIPRELGLDSYETLRREIYRGLRIAFAEVELFPDVAPLIGRCREAGAQVALVTSAPRFVLDDVLPRVGLGESFDHVVCAEDVTNFKPHPEPVHKTLAALVRLPREAIMIGDSAADILAGKAAGTATALYLTDTHAPFHREHELRATNPDHIFERHDELGEILGLDGS